MWRDFTHVDDILNGVVTVLDNPPADDGAVKAGGSVKPHALYNIGNNRSENLLDFVRVLEQACGREATIDWQPMQNGDVVRTFADIDAIASDLGYEPTVTIADGLPRFVEWYRAYHGV